MDGLTEAEELAALLDSPGWQVFTAHAAAEWGPRGFQDKVLAALATAEGSEVASRVAQLASRRAEVEMLILWPRQRIQALERLRVEE